MKLDEQALELLSGYLDDALAPQERARAEQLLADSEEARRLLEDYRRDQARLKALPLLKAPPARLPSRPVGAGPSATRWLRAAVVLVLVGAAAWLLTRPPGVPRLALRGQLGAGLVWLQPGGPPAHFEFSGLVGHYRVGESCRLVIRLDGENKQPGSAQVTLRYDYEGDGTVDRTETYAAFAVDTTPGFQTYTENAGPLHVEGTRHRDFENGKLLADVSCPRESATPVAVQPDELGLLLEPPHGP